jgi:hypothetical protein
MSTTVTIRDTSTTGDTLHEFALELLTEHTTARELIRSRVYQEVQDHNQRPPEVFRGLVQPTEAERALNDSRPRKPRPLNWKQQYEKALEAFRTNRFLLLVDDQQVESLDEEITIRPGSCISFLKLTPLAGG